MQKDAKSLGAIALQVIQTGKSRPLSDEEQKQFYLRFRDSVSPQIEKLKEEQRVAFEKGHAIVIR